MCVIQVFNSDNHQRNADVELQQRSVEYILLSRVATTDVLVSVLFTAPSFKNSIVVSAANDTQIILFFLFTVFFFRSSFVSHFFDINATN